MREVFKRRLDPIHVESARLLEECLTKNGGKPDLGKVITAFLGPSLRMGNAENAATFRKLAGLAATDPSPEVREIFLELTDESAARFVDRYSKKSMSGAFQYRLALAAGCVFGTLFYVRANTGRLQRLPGIDIDFGDTDEALRHLVPILVSGFGATVTD